MYMDLALEFVKNGHEVTVIAGDAATTYRIENGMNVLRVKSLPILYVKSMIKKYMSLLRNKSEN